MENIRSLIIEAMVQYKHKLNCYESEKSNLTLSKDTGKKYRVPRKKGVYYTFDMVSTEFCDIHEAFQHFRKK